MFKFFTDLAKALNPHISDTPDQIFAWRQTVMFAILMSLTLQVGFMMHVYGALGWADLPGFARQNEVAGLESAFKEFRLTQLEEMIDRVRTRQCNAILMKNQAAFEATVSEMRSLSSFYRATAKRDYPVKTCDQLLVPLG